MALFNKSTVSFLLLGLTAQVQVQVEARPNIIIMQPDDLPFLDEWSAPPNVPNDDGSVTNTFPDNGDYNLANIETLRLNGVQFMQAYAASPMCGTSRYSTITGKMPSRAASVRSKYDSDSDDPAVVTIPTTKLEDIGGLNDCSAENLAASFQRDEDYKTAMFGKWHLSTIKDEDYNYDEARGIVQNCGFDTVEALYIENLSKEGGFNSYCDEIKFSHNMEWMTYEAIKFINTTIADDDNFFMYFNPTVPHSSNDVVLAITDFDCTDTADSEKAGDATVDPWIKGMSEDAGCRAYRDSIMERAKVDGDHGKIWLDDAVGALLDALRDNDELENTIFLFQEDHGMDTKSGLYEGGIRIPQFVHYPNGITPGTTFEGLVSTVDIAATMMDFAGIIPDYELDGKSWKDAIENTDEEEYWKHERCLFFELEQDRAVRCGCYKYLNIFEAETKTYRQGYQSGLSNNIGGNLFDLCGETDEYITAKDDNQEESTTDDGVEAGELIGALECHLQNTDPKNDPDYSVCTDSNVVGPPITTDDDDDDDDDDMSAPTCDDSPFQGIFGRHSRRCVWIAKNKNCDMEKFWSHCKQSCGKCTDSSKVCIDSQLAFSYGTLDNTKCADLAQNDCDDAGVAQTCPGKCNSSCW